MNIRTKNDLYDHLASSSKFRKRELISLSGLVSSENCRQHHKEIYCRSAVSLSYAHWEGYVKDASEFYVDYISNTSSPFKNLKSNFQALYCKQLIFSAEKATKKIEPHINLINALVENVDVAVSFDIKKTISTDSNLNFSVFNNLCLSLGIDASAFWKTYSAFIDDLFTSRCEIVHGDRFVPEEKYALETVDFTLKAIDWYAADIMNAALSCNYLRS